MKLVPLYIAYQQHCRCSVLNPRLRVPCRFHYRHFLQVPLKCTLLKALQQLLIGELGDAQGLLFLIAVSQVLLMLTAVIRK